MTVSAFNLPEAHTSVLRAGSAHFRSVATSPTVCSNLYTNTHSASRHQVACFSLSDLSFFDLLCAGSLDMVQE